MKQVFISGYNTTIPLVENYYIFVESIKNRFDINSFYIVHNHSIIQEYNFDILKKNDIIHIENIVHGGRKSYPNITTCTLILLYPILVLVLYYIMYRFVYKNLIRIHQTTSLSKLFYIFIFYFYLYTSYLYVSLHKESSLFYLLFGIPLLIPIIIALLNSSAGLFMYIFICILSIIGIIVYISIQNKTFPGIFVCISILEVILYGLFVYMLSTFYSGCKEKYFVLVIGICSLFAIPFILQSYIDYTE